MTRVRATAPPLPSLLACAEAAALVALTADAPATTADAPAPAPDAPVAAAAPCSSDVMAWCAAAPPDHPLRRIADGFVLDPAEVQLIALLYAAALSERVAAAVQAACAHDRRGVPLWLALRLIPALTPAHVAADATLCRFGFVAHEADTPRIDARLWLDDAVIDRLAGLTPRDGAISARCFALIPNPDLAPAALTAELDAALRSRGADQLSPLILAGTHALDQIAASLSALGLNPVQLRAADIPAEPEARDGLARRWSREAALGGAALIILTDAEGAADAAAAADFADRVTGHVVIAGTGPLPHMRRALRLLSDVDASSAIPATRWQRALGPARAARLGHGVARVAAQFRLAPAEIDAVCAQAAGAIDAAADAKTATQALWHQAGRAALGAPVPGVAIIEPVYDWADIILPPPVEAALRRIETHVSHATTVLDDWGFARAMGARGRGVVALFSGPSGTGKTMAAEVLASSLDLRMMVIDLSQIISKYVGETSKNIAAAFVQAERSGAVMVWNEGDAIWGARGSVGHATDRHVNAEVGDLLQRIEAFRGFTIVTTNMRHAIDPAFLRRFRFTIDFPMPAAAERVRLWQRAFPADAPVERIDWRALADLPLSGGSIRNVALGSAFLAAASGGRINRALIEAELGEELRKHDQSVPLVRWAEDAP